MFLQWFSNFKVCQNSNRWSLWLSRSRRAAWDCILKFPGCWWLLVWRPSFRNDCYYIWSSQEPTMMLSSCRWGNWDVKKFMMFPVVRNELVVEQRLESVEAPAGFLLLRASVHFPKQPLDFTWSVFLSHFFSQPFLVFRYTLLRYSHLINMCLNFFPF